MDVAGTDNLRAAVQAFAAANLNPPLLVAQGFADGALEDGADPDRHVLDAICPDRPDHMGEPLHDPERLAELGVAASVNPPHVPGSGDFPMQPAMDLIGQDRRALSCPWKTLAEAGAPVCFFSDWPVAVLPPLKGMEMALNRAPFSAETADERLSFDAT